MTVKFTFPVFYEATVAKRGGSRLQKMLFREVLDISLPVIDGSHVQTAVVWSEQPGGQRTEWLNRSTVWHGGSHLRAVRRNFFDEKALVAAAVDKIQKPIRCPFRIEDAVDFDPSVYDVRDGRQRNQALFGAERTAKNLAVIGNSLYERVQDPGFFVNRAHKHRKGGEWSYAIRPAETATESLTTRYFSLNDFDLVKEYSSGAAEMNGRYRVEVLMPESLSVDFFEHDLFNAALLAARMTCDKLYENAPWSVSPEVQEPWLKLQGMLPHGFNGDFGFLPNDIDYTELADLTEELHSYLEFDVDKTRYPELRYMREALNMFRERPLEFSPSGFGV